MDYWILVLAWIAFGIFLVTSLGFIFTSIIEKRLRATWLASAIFIPLNILFLLALQLDYPGKSTVLGLLLGIGIAGLSFIVFPKRKNDPLHVLGQQSKNDERNAIFHRFYRLKPGMKEFDIFYKDHPELKEVDDKIRSLPELGEPGSRSFHGISSQFATATFDVIERITRDVEWDAMPRVRKADKASPKELTTRIKGFAKFAGAVKTGVTELNPAYIYSHIGRSPGKWGSPITLNHKYAIAIAVEMDHEYVRHAPDSITMTETAYKYFEAAKVAMMVARYIQYLGFEARAHVDGNYRIMCVPVAADAGLGELGRLGLLITPEYGPRIRLAAVTTNMPLLTDKPIAFGVQDFCDFCKKCATNCPSAAIDKGDKKDVNGVEKWQSSQEDCYRFWRKQGSDCSVCVNVCPYSHPNSPLHDVVRWAIKRNGLIRRLALLGDDFFYGRRPGTIYRLPDWHNTNE